MCAEAGTRPAIPHDMKALALLSLSMCMLAACANDDGTTPPGTDMAGLSEPAPARTNANGVIVDGLMPPPTTDTTKQGFIGGYMGVWRIGGGVYYSNGSASCVFNSPPDLLYSTGLRPDQAMELTFVPTPPDGSHCRVIVRPGLFRVGGGVFYSNGSHTCGFATPNHLQALTGVTDVSGLFVFDRYPDMPYDGPCGG